MPKSEVLKIGGTGIRVVTREALIAMKKMIRPLRDKDRLDIKQLAERARQS